VYISLKGIIHNIIKFIHFEFFKSWLMLIYKTHRFSKTPTITKLKPFVSTFESKLNKYTDTSYTNKCNDGSKFVFRLFYYD
jgi:hypothetical protein